MYQEGKSFRSLKHMEDKYKMADNRNMSLPGCGRDTVYIDTNRILDSCRDKDCFEDVTVYLTDCGREAVERGGNVRTICSKVIAAVMNVDPVPFNRGFYQVSIRMYVKLVCEICVGAGRTQEVDGICAVEKKVVLFGSEGNISVFRSRPDERNFCSGGSDTNVSTNLPTAVLEVADPIILSTKIIEACRCDGCRAPLCLCESELPEAVTNCIDGRLCTDTSGKHLAVTLGFFSVVRIERPGQYLVNGTEYTVPEKECVMPANDDPCSMFRHMAFPVDEFYPPSLGDVSDRNDSKGFGTCGCKK